ncbi:hypothetical protein OG898_28345 [Streptomyces sp. NBC_00193]|uniref:hypothetical protein n=1 Tax=unclassified Streptomyces TaxID=2593676 RepID=UPI0022573871|nr:MULTISPECIES: hypothetical protein [unclassified Streptomyces]MCX5129979.1 hypothetical protein [Streptomyces sp. NBC_00347]MCX5300345.1 hypothetical protein [Streptomyces sp. NBC_00193]
MGEGRRETWTTEEFGSSHSGAAGVLLADGTVPDRFEAAGRPHPRVIDPSPLREACRVGKDSGAVSLRRLRAGYSALADSGTDS